MLSLATTIGFSQEKKSVNSDTLFVDITKTKVIKIDKKTYELKQFTEQKPVFFPVELWATIIGIINKREYGNIEASTILQIIQSISAQVK